jgi:hypothetical protein
MLDLEAGHEHHLGPPGDRQDVLEHGAEELHKLLALFRLGLMNMGLIPPASRWQSQVPHQRCQAAHRGA